MEYGQIYNHRAHRFFMYHSGAKALVEKMHKRAVEYDLPEDAPEDAPEWSAVIVPRGAICVEQYAGKPSNRSR